MAAIRWVSDPKTIAMAVPSTLSDSIEGKIKPLYVLETATSNGGTTQGTWQVAAKLCGLRGLP